MVQISNQTHFTNLFSIRIGEIFLSKSFHWSMINNLKESLKENHGKH